MTFAYNDGGRSQYFRGEAGDCVVRAIAIATNLDYKILYNDFRKLMGNGNSPRNGVPKKIYHKYLTETLGFTWISYMKIGSGCTVNLRDMLHGGSGFIDGVVIARLSRHLTTIIDGTVNDTYYPGDHRCVYGVYIK